jgi:hypothetical protein
MLYIQSRSSRWEKLEAYNISESTQFLMQDHETCNHYEKPHSALGKIISIPVIIHSQVFLEHGGYP